MSSHRIASHPIPLRPHHHPLEVATLLRTSRFLHVYFHFLFKLLSFFLSSFYNYHFPVISRTYLIMHRIHIVTAPPTPYALSERQEAMQIELCSSNSFLRFAYLIQVQV